MQMQSNQIMRLIVNGRWLSALILQGLCICDSFQVFLGGV